MDNIIISIELVKKGYILYIGTEGSASLFKIHCKDRNQLNREIKSYINEYIDYSEQFN